MSACIARSFRQISAATLASVTSFGTSRQSLVLGRFTRGTCSGGALERVHEIEEGVGGMDVPVVQDLVGEQIAGVQRLPG